MFEQKLDILKQSLGKCYNSNDEFMFHCPKCNHHKRKLSVNIDKNVFKCWVCDYRGTNLADLIRSSSLRSKWRDLTSVVNLDRFSDLFTEKQEESRQILELPEYFNTLSAKNLSKAGMQAKRYLTGRGLTEQQILMYKIGFCFHGKYKNRIVIPSFDCDGHLNYFIARSYKNTNFKYMNPPASRDIVFNDIFIDWSRPVVLVEGFFDSIKIDNSIPILGSSLSTNSNLFKKIIKNCSKVYICLDSDAKKKELKIIKNLLDFGVEVAKIKLNNYSDLGDVPASELTGLKKQADIITQSDYLLYMINSGGG